MSYISGSEGPSVSGYDVQGPKKLPDSAFGKATQPTVMVVYEQCDRVIISVETGSIHLLQSTHTASVGSTLVDADAGKFVKAVTYQTGSAAALPAVTSITPQTFDLPVNAMAFSGSDGATTGNVTFIYRGGL